MIKKFLILAVPLLIIFSLLPVWHQLQSGKNKYPPPKNNPGNSINTPPGTDREPLHSSGETLYSDGESTVHAQDSTVVIRHNGKTYRQNILPSGKEPVSVKIINNKPPAEPPVMGTGIKKGIKLITDQNISIVQLEPEYKFMLSYPNPHTGDDKIMVHKHNNMLYLYKNGELVKYYQVATGKEPYYTPEGKFVITNKSPYPRGKDPDSQLGTRWLGISVPCARDRRAQEDERAPMGIKYGIHGTNEPDSIGTHASGGCVRMNNKEVEEIYDLVDIGTAVEIVN